MPQIAAPRAHGFQMTQFSVMRPISLKLPRAKVVFFDSVDGKVDGESLKGSMGLVNLLFVNLCELYGLFGLTFLSVTVSQRFRRGLALHSRLSLDPHGNSLPLPTHSIEGRPPCISTRRVPSRMAQLQLCTKIMGTLILWIIRKIGSSRCPTLSLHHCGGGKTH